MKLSNIIEMDDISITTCVVYDKELREVDEIESVVISLGGKNFDATSVFKDQKNAKGNDIAWNLGDWHELAANYEGYTDFDSFDSKIKTNENY